MPLADDRSTRTSVQYHAPDPPRTYVSTSNQHEKRIYEHVVAVTINNVAHFVFLLLTFILE